jgi:hypothetical protein
MSVASEDLEEPWPAFELVVGRCVAEIHEPSEEPLQFCVRIRGISLCGDCIDIYSWGFDEAVGRWRARQREVDRVPAQEGGQHQSGRTEE